jgi:predicted amidophosphoribosyltransferase
MCCAAAMPLLPWRLSTHDALCPACWSGIDFIRAPLCDCLGLPMPYDTGGRSIRDPHPRGCAGIQVEPLVLLRVRASKPQVGLSRGQRRQNVAGAFAVAAGRESTIAGANDDVITTGATAGARARVLKRAGAARVDVLALALVEDAGVVAS